MAGNRKKSSIEKRRKLSALYARGAEVRFSEEGVVDSPRVKGKHQTLKEWQAENKGDDGEAPEAPDHLWPSDDDVVVWIQPPDPLQREEAVRAASAAKARALIGMRNPESQVSLEAEMTLGELDMDALRDYIVDATTRDVRSRAMRDVLAKEEWEDFTALQDSMREWEEAGFPETDEWAGLMERDREYGRQIQERVTEIIEDTRDGLKLIGEDELRKRSKKRYAETVGNQAFMQAYELHMLFFGVRDGDDHLELFFEEADEIKEQEEFVQIAMAEALSKFISDPREAKNSRRVAPGSEQSVLPAAQETSEASIPEEQSA